MANIRQLKDKNDAVFYPQTHIKAVVDSNSNTVEDILDSLSLGIDQTDSMVYIYVNGVKQGTGIDVAEIVGVVHSISYTLAPNMDSSNDSTEILHGQSYSSVISSTNPDYSVNSITVMMKGVDVSSSVVSGNTINILRVTGNISIAVT